MAQFENLGLLSEFMNGVRIRSFSWQHGDLGKSSMPITILTEEDLSLNIVCSKDLSDEIRDLDGRFEYSISSLDGSAECLVSQFDITKYIVYRVIKEQKSFIRLTSVVVSRVV